MRISTRLFLYILTVLAILGAGLGYVSVKDERSHLMDEMRSRVWLFARTLAAVLRSYHPAGPDVDMQAMLDEIVPSAPGEIPYVRLYDAQGAPRDLSCPSCQSPPFPHTPLVLGAIPSEGREKVISAGREEYLSVLLPVRGDGERVQGAVEVVLSLEHVRTALAQLVRRFLVFFLAVGAFLALMIFLIARWGINLPLRRLQEAARKLGEGDLALRIGASGVADLDELTDEFNRMAGRLEDQSAKREASHRERIELEVGLRHTEKLASVGQLVSGLAHEIGTPLNLIGGRAEHLLSGLEEGDAQRKPLQVIAQQSERIAHVIRRLMTFSRKGKAAFSPVSLEASIREAFDLCRLQTKSGREGARLDLNVAEDEIVADGDGLRQLFVNLMLNSLQAAPGPGTIRIRVDPDPLDPERIRITYEDDGPGIPETIRGQVFDPFFTTKDVGEGTGLGLYVVANIVEEHGGTVSAGEARSGGARFTILLPRRSGQGPAGAQRESPS
ncbi:MAG: sensor histidine kinase [Planctomycetota bacterium]